MSSWERAVETRVAECHRLRPTEVLRHPNTWHVHWGIASTIDGQKTLCVLTHRGCHCAAHIHNMLLIIAQEKTRFLVKRLILANTKPHITVADSSSWSERIGWRRNSRPIRLLPQLLIDSQVARTDQAISPLTRHYKIEFATVTRPFINAP